jgi:hydroxymethylbilane synthase
MQERITSALSDEVMLPAIAQGVIGIECRSGDTRVRELIEALNPTATATRTAAERGMNARLAGGCQAPVAGYSEILDGNLELRGLVGRPDGTGIIRGAITGPCEEAEALGRELAEDLLARGADVILKELLDN